MKSQLPTTRQLREQLMESNENWLFWTRITLNLIWVLSLMLGVISLIATVVTKEYSPLLGYAILYFSAAAAMWAFEAHILEWIERRVFNLEKQLKKYLP